MKADQLLNQILPILHSVYRKKWFAFKQQKLEEYVWQVIEHELKV